VQGASQVVGGTSAAAPLSAVSVVPPQPMPMIDIPIHFGSAMASAPGLGGPASAGVGAGGAAVPPRQIAVEAAGRDPVEILR
jgi:hypothetical protein